MEASGFTFDFSREYLKAALLVSLLSVWMLVGLFIYLNRYTRRNYFTVWTAAWLFYALWLTMTLNGDPHPATPWLLILRQWCVCISAVFLLWGSLVFLGLPVRQTLFGLFILFLLVWTYVSAQMMSDTLIMQMPVFILMGLGSVFAAVSFYRLRKRMPFVGAGMLSTGFFLWGLYLSTYPLTQTKGYENLYNAGFFVAAVLQLFIAVSMIVLVLEEVRFKNEQILKEITAIQSEKAELQLKVLTTEEQCRELFDQVRLTEGLQKAYDELRLTQNSVMQQERLRALGQMASGIAHDINNALSPVVAYSELLLRDCPELTPDARRQLECIRRSGEDIAHIVTRMREFYRRRSGAEELTGVCMNDVLEEVIEMTKPRWKDMVQGQGRQINLHKQFETPLPTVPSNASELREAFTNLIFNALDAMPTGGNLTLSTRSLKVKGGSHRQSPCSHVVVEVTDDGIGMDEQTRQHCLEPFVSTKTQRGGTGLGLAMVFGMMERHEGAIEIESQPGQGATFRLVFPVRGMIAKGSRSASGTDAFARPLRLLCIDDEPLLRELLRDALTTFKHDVVTADGGRQGIEFFHKAAHSGRPFELVITDLGMPEVDGRQVVAAIKAASPSTPIILLTGWGTMLRDEHDIPAQVDGVLSKPPRLKELASMITRVAAPRTSATETSSSARAA